MFLVFPKFGPLQVSSFVFQNLFPFSCFLEFLIDIHMQTEKCGDYFQAEDGPREFGNICIVTKWIRTTDTSLVLRNIEVNYKEVRQ